MNIYLRKNIYFVCKTNIFCIKKYFSNERYIFYTFIYFFLCKKKKIHHKTFFPYKNIFSASNVYFVKNINIKKKFSLVLQQMNNRSHPE